MRHRTVMIALVLGATLLLGCGASAAPCGGDFDAWLETFKREAASKGVSQRTISGALDDVKRDPKIVALDQRQGVFKQSFEEFAAQRIASRMQKATHLMQQHAGLLNRIEQQYAVPGPVVIAIWGLETDFGVATGKHPAIRALATLAHDCRRTEMFQAELLDALRIIERGDLAPSEMRGAWAGALG